MTTCKKSFLLEERNLDINVNSYKILEYKIDNNNNISQCRIYDYVINNKKLEVKIIEYKD